MVSVLPWARRSRRFGRGTSAMSWPCRRRCRGQVDAVGSGSLDADPDHRADRLQPLLDLRIAGCGGGEFAVRQFLAVFVDDCDVVGVGVGVDADEDRSFGDGCVQREIVLFGRGACRTNRGWPGQSRDGALGAACSYQVTTPTRPGGCAGSGLHHRRGRIDGSCERHTSRAVRKTSESGPSGPGDTPESSRPLG